MQEATLTDQIRDVFLRLLDIYLLFVKHFVLFFVPRRLRFKEVKDEIVLVTGAGSGLGRLLSVEFARRNATVVLWDVDQSGIEETKKMIKEEGGDAHCYLCDVSHPQQVYATAKRVKQDIGVVTILVNNAGVLVGDDFMSIEDAKIRKTFEVNAMGPMWMCKAFLGDMMENNHGHVVNVASLGGLIGFPRLSDYGASKFALVGFDESLKIELMLGGYTGVRTTVVCPTFFSSGLYRGLGRSWLTPELSVRHVCREIMAAVLTDQERAVIPYLGNFANIMKTILPLDICIRCMDLAGCYHTMKSFVGARGHFVSTQKTDKNGIGQNNNVLNGKIAID